MVKVGVYGASGYTGQELLKHLLFHPAVTIVAITSRRYAGVPLADVYPAFQGLTSLSFMNVRPMRSPAWRMSCFGPSHGVSMTVAPAFLQPVKK